VPYCNSRFAPAEVDNDTSIPNALYILQLCIDILNVGDGFFMTVLNYAESIEIQSTR
jgi:hypothetical protein